MSAHSPVVCLPTDNFSPPKSDSVSRAIGRKFVCVCVGGGGGSAVGESAGKGGYRGGGGCL